MQEAAQVHGDDAKVTRAVREMFGEANYYARYLLKTNGANTINGVKAEGHAVVPPVQHVPQPPVVATAATVQAVQGVAGSMPQNCRASKPH